MARTSTAAPAAPPSSPPPPTPMTAPASASYDETTTTTQEPDQVIMQQQRQKQELAFEEASLRVENACKGLVVTPEQKRALLDICSKYIVTVQGTGQAGGADVQALIDAWDKVALQINNDPTNEARVAQKASLRVATSKKVGGTVDNPITSSSQQQYSVDQINNMKGTSQGAVDEQGNPIWEDYDPAVDGTPGEGVATREVVKETIPGKVNTETTQKYYTPSGREISKEQYDKLYSDMKLKKVKKPSKDESDINEILAGGNKWSFKKDEGEGEGEKDDSKKDEWK